MTFKVAFWPGARIVPAGAPLVVNTALGTLILEIVTLKFPESVSDTLNVLLEPMVTFPKLRLAGLTPSRAFEAVPVPLTEIWTVELEALL